MIEPKDCEFLCVNGILTKEHDIKGWPDRAEVFYQNKGLIASRYKYESGAFTRFVYQGKRVKEVTTILKRSIRPVIYVGHSNGCEIFSRLVKETRYKFPAAHLFAPAVDADFKRNGFNAALKSERIGKLYIYGSANDTWLKHGHRWTGWLRKIGLGYGNLGQVGPINLDLDLADRVILTWRDNYNHSTWLNSLKIKDSLEMTLRL